MQPEDKPKENKAISPVNIWDATAIKMMKDILAPKGYKIITNGNWRGLQIANSDHPGLVKSKVQKASNLGAQLVRAFREQFRAKIAERVVYLEGERDKAVAEREACAWWQFATRKKHQKVFEYFRDQIGVYLVVEGWLDQITPPQKREEKKEGEKA